MTFILSLLIVGITMTILYQPFRLIPHMTHRSEVSQEDIEKAGGPLQRIFLVVFNLPYPYFVRMLIIILIAAYAFLWIYFLFTGLILAWSNSFIVRGDLSDFMRMALEGIVMFFKS